jgi:methionine aminopeptidase
MCWLSADGMPSHRGAGSYSFLSAHTRPRKVGAKLVDLCEAGDAAILAETKKHYVKKKEMRKGIAFPTCISVNNVVGHFCPAAKDDKTVLAEGDLVKIDLGVHFDGYASQMAHTIIASDKPTEAIKVVDGVGWLGWLVGWLVGRLVGWLVGLLVG